MVSNGLPSEKSPTTTLLHWSGSCIEDDASVIEHQTLRIVAFQTAGQTGDLKLWIQQMATHLRTIGAHVRVFTETRIHGNDRHTLVINTFLEHGFLALSHNTTQSRKPIQSNDEEDDLMGPKAAGVILVLVAEFAGGWTDIIQMVGP